MNTADKNGLCPLSSSTPFTISGRGGSIMDVQPICSVTPVLAASHLQPAFVHPNHRHPPAYTPYIYSVFDTVEVGGKTAHDGSLRGQNQQKSIQVPDIRSCAQGAEMGVDKNPQMEAVRDVFTERIQLESGNSNQVSSKNDPVPVLSEMHRNFNSPSVSDFDCNKGQGGCNQIPREVRTERTQVERMGKSQNHCSIHSPSYLQIDMNFTANTNWKAAMNNEESNVGSGQNACPLHSSLLRQMSMNMNSNSAPVNQNHCEKRGDAESFQMGGSQSQNHPQLRYSTIGQLPVKINNTSKQAPVEPVTLRANNSSLTTVKTGYGGEISAGAREGRGNPAGLVTVKTECGSESTDGANERKGNSVGLVRVKKEHGSEITAGDEEEKGNSVGLVTVKQEYGSEFTTWFNEGRGNYVGLAEAASLNIKATTNVENRGGMAALATVGGNTVRLTEYGNESAAGAKKGKGNSAGLVTVKKENGSEITAGTNEGKGNSVGLVRVKQEYVSQFAVGSKGGENSVGLAEPARLNVNTAINAENRGGMGALAIVGANIARVAESTLNRSDISGGVTVAQSNAAEVLESERLKLKNLFDLTVLKADYENQLQVTPEANMQRGIVPGQKLSSINSQVPNVDQLRSALAMNLSRFKDLTVLGTGSMLQTPGNLLAETETYRRKRKYVVKETSVVRTTEENASSNGDDRERVRKAMMTFDALRRNLMNEDEFCKELGGAARRPDLKAGTIMMDKGQWINRGRRFIGPVPGVHVGDHFYFRMELCVIGLHGPSQAGIDFITAKNNQWNEPVAISIISSGGYEVDDDGGDVLIYTGQGGNNYIADKKQSFDQKLERGNLALERSMHYGVEIRVIRGVKDNMSPSGKIYIYDGLYKVEQSWLDKGRSGCGVFKYKLHRIPGQPELGSAILKSTRLWKAQPLTRAGLLYPDISLGIEKLPVPLSNNVDNEKGPPHFEYTSKTLRYQNPLVQLDSSEGCMCVGGCGLVYCLCAQRNGKQIPYNSNGILIKGKSLIYECNEQCRCPPSCRNRVTQRGLNVHLEVFRTSDKKWGVRSWDPLAAGTFISEYTGQVFPIEEQAAICNSDSEYVLNLKHAQKGTEWGSVSDILCEQQQREEGSNPVFPPTNFLIDANKFGNVSRFIKHSSCPNLLMQFVLHDHLDIRFPHVMLFARDNIPPLTELTFDYGSVPASYSEESGENRVLVKVEPVLEYNQSAIDYKHVD